MKSMFLKFFSSLEEKMDWQEVCLHICYVLMSYTCVLDKLNLKRFCEIFLCRLFLQCFDAVGWVAGRASGL